MSREACCGSLPLLLATGSGKVLLGAAGSIHQDIRPGLTASQQPQTYITITAAKFFGRDFSCTKQTHYSHERLVKIEFET